MVDRVWKLRTEAQQDPSGLDSFHREDALVGSCSSDASGAAGGRAEHGLLRGTPPEAPHGRNTVFPHFCVQCVKDSRARRARQLGRTASTSGSSCASDATDTAASSTLSLSPSEQHPHHQHLLPSSGEDNTQPPPLALPTDLAQSVATPAATSPALGFHHHQTAALVQQAQQRRTKTAARRPGTSAISRFGSMRQSLTASRRIGSSAASVAHAAVLHYSCITRAAATNAKTSTRAAPAALEQATAGGASAASDPTTAVHTGASCVMRAVSENRGTCVKGLGCLLCMRNVLPRKDMSIYFS